jgi:hypothetical protein
MLDEHRLARRRIEVRDGARNDERRLGGPKARNDERRSRWQAQ